MGELDKLFWLRIALGIAGGLSSGLLGFLGPGPEAISGVFLAIILYIFSYIVGKFVLVRKISQPEARKVYTTALGSFIMLYLFVWILFNTLARSS